MSLENVAQSDVALLALQLLIVDESSHEHPSKKEVNNESQTIDFLPRKTNVHHRVVELSIHTRLTSRTTYNTQHVRDTIAPHLTHGDTGETTRGEARGKVLEAVAEARAPLSNRGVRVRVRLVRKPELQELLVHPLLAVDGLLPRNNLLRGGDDGVFVTERTQRQRTADSGHRDVLRTYECMYVLGNRLQKEVKHCGEYTLVDVFEGHIFCN